MKRLFTIFFIGNIASFCSTNKLDLNTSSYIKVIINGDAIKPNAYNKGLGMDYYSYFDLHSDSLLYLYPEFTESIDRNVLVNHAFKGKLDNAKFRDTVLHLFYSLDWRPVGSIHNIPDGSVNCGWEYYVEFNVGEKIKYYVVTAGVSDTLDRFLNFFQRLEHSAWTKQTINPNIINIDNEVVAEMKRFGSYDKREVPYLFPECDNGIDFTKLVGRWRKVGTDYHSTKKDRFLSYTLNSDRTFALQRYTGGKSKVIVKGTYSIDLKAAKIFYEDAKGNKMTQTVSQLTDSCFSVNQTSYGGGSSSIKLNRY